MRSLAAIALGLSLAACAAPPLDWQEQAEEMGRKERPLDYAAAVLVLVQPSEGEAQEEALLRLDEVALEKAIVAALRELCPLRVVEGVGRAGVAPAELEDGQLPREWLDELHDKGHDILVYAQVKPRGDLGSWDYNTLSMASVPLYWLLGPLAWWLPDRRYNLQVDVSLQVHELHGWPADGDPATDTLLDSKNINTADLALDFVQRAGWTGWLCSPIVPTLFAPQNDETVRERLANKVSLQIGKEAASLLRGESWVSRPTGIDILLHRTGPSRAEVRVEPKGNLDRLRVGEGKDVPNRELLEDDRYLLYPLPNPVAPGDPVRVHAKSWSGHVLCKTFVCE
ncbi:MAG: hypothetical protein AB1486_20060 [Planctomycetota bacterium]